MPEDPFTKLPDWQVVYEELDPDRPGETPGVFDVKSSSDMVSLSGTSYSEW